MSKTVLTVLTVYLGRFSPFHNGHAEVLKRAQIQADIVLVLVGSINQAPNPKNPWSYEQRADLIKSFANKPSANNVVSKNNVHIRGIRDYPYNDQLWIANVHKVINEFITLTLNKDPSEIEIKITGADRDSSTFYLKYFPTFKSDLVEENLEVSSFLTATTVREIYFGKSFNGNKITTEHAELLLKSFLPTQTISFLRDFESTEMYDSIREEHLFNVEYKKQFKDLPYEPIFQTVDACVIQTGHILLIRRKSRPGKGLWALPGGFVNANERLFDAAIRELKEETKIKVPDPILRSSMVFKEDFDYPDRSLRGRTISKGFLFKLPDFVVDGAINLPLVKGSDDAEKARWVPIDEILKYPDRMFEDHYSIIETMLGKL